MSELSMLHPVFNNLPNEIKGLSTRSLKKARSLIVTWSPSNVSNAKLTSLMSLVAISLP